MDGQATKTLAVNTSDERIYSTVQQEVEIGVRALSGRDAKMAIMLFQSALQKLSIRQSFHDHLVHNLLLSYKLQIEQYLERGQNDDAASVLERALKLEILGEMALDLEFRKSFALVFDSLGLLFFRHGQFDKSVGCCRKALSIQRSPGLRINLENALRASGQRALLSDFTADHENEQLGRHIFIACVPKSGSTFLKNALVSITGYRDAFMVYTSGQFEQDLYLPMLDSVAAVDTVTQQHCRASDANVQLMQAFGIKPVVLVRNIFDSVISLLDFYNKGAFSNSFFRSDYLSLDDQTRIDLLIDNLVPWYFQFIASWSEVEKQKGLEVFWLTYEDLIGDKSASIQNVLKFYGLGAAPRAVEQKIKEAEAEKRNTRFNKGVAGRGRSGLSNEQKIRISRLARYYPATDFSRIGL